ncbi:MAG: hypothetical protein MUE91_01970, partial [Ignavibacteriaceae bacterium]|nr:hypothetical protein [Ignavibacteriaceae bacterium]
QRLALLVRDARRVRLRVELRALADLERGLVAHAGEIGVCLHTGDRKGNIQPAEHRNATAEQEGTDSKVHQRKHACHSGHR